MNSVDVSPSSGFSHVYDSMNNTISDKTNPLVLIALTAIIIFYFIVFSYLGYNVQYSQAPQSGGMRFIEIVMWGLVVFLVLINGIQYFFKIDVKTAVKNVFSGKPEVDIKIEPEKELKGKKNGGSSGSSDELGRGAFGEVFNIPGNQYTYEQGKALCKAYGAKLASYSQVEDAYKSGAEWCNYGWSDNQLALFPTQKSTWHNLQKIKGHEHNCGRPGINGGYIKNPNVRFGVNCYGNKPNITAEEQKLMKNSTPYPLTKEDKYINSLVEKYKKNLSNLLISPFNYKSWNRI